MKKDIEITAPEEMVMLSDKEKVKCILLFAEELGIDIAIKVIDEKMQSRIKSSVPLRITN